MSKCTCLVVADKRKGRKLPGSGTTEDPYVIESTNIEALSNGVSELQILPGEAVRLPRAIKRINYGGKDSFPQNETIYWDTPVKNFDISTEDTPEVQTQEINVIQYGANQIRFTGNKQVYNKNLIPNKGSYAIAPSDHYLDESLIGQAQLNIALGQSPIQDILLNEVTLDFNTGFENLLSDARVTFLSTKTAERTFTCSFDIDDFDSASFPVPIAGERLGFQLWIGMKMVGVAAYDMAYKVADIEFAPAGPRKTAKQYSFVNKVSFEKGKMYTLYLYPVYRYNYIPSRVCKIRNLTFTTTGFT